MVLCLVDVLVLLPAGLHKASQTRWGMFPSWQDACCTMVSDMLQAGKTPAVETCNLWGGTETCSGCLSWTELQSGAFPQSIFLILLGFNTYHLGYSC